MVSTTTCVLAYKDTQKVQSGSDLQVCCHRLLKCVEFTGETMALKTGCRFPSEPVRSNYRLTETGDTREGGGMLPLSYDSHTHSVHLGHGSLWQLLHGLYQAQQV